MKEINLCEKDRFTIYGLDDECFIIVNKIKVNNDINVPVILYGKVYQIDTEENKVNELGEDYNVQVSLTVDGVWQDE